MIAMRCLIVRIRYVIKRALKGATRILSLKEFLMLFRTIFASLLSTILAETAAPAAPAEHHGKF
jgi:hypothetical protein